MFAVVVAADGGVALLLLVLGYGQTWALITRLPLLCFVALVVELVARHRCHGLVPRLGAWCLVLLCLICGMVWYWYQSVR